MGPVGSGLEFRMVLAGDEEGMIGKFHDFHQSVFVIDGADDQPRVFQFVAGEIIRKRTQRKIFAADVSRVRAEVKRRFKF